MRFLYRLLYLGVFLSGSAAFVSCSSDDNSDSSSSSKKSIVILFESDSHSELSGYPKLAGLRDAISQSDTAWVGVVCCGDFMQGGVAASVSKGKYVVDIMRSVGYDAVTLGNHEFEYGGANMENLLSQLGVPVVCANLFSHGESASLYPAYTLHRYGNKTVAFIGVLTPETIVTQKFAFFDGDGHQLYDLTGDGLKEQIQKAVDNARGEGADYVVLLSHMGEKSDISLTSHDIVKATRGIDVVLDGHTHSSVPHEYVENIDGKPVLMSQSGNQFRHIGKLVIKANGEFSTTLLPTEEVTAVSASVATVVESVIAEVNKQTSVVICHSDYPLLSLDEEGSSASTMMETSIGDLLTDAYRHLFDSDVALQSGATLRNDIAAGDITKRDVMNLLPFEDQMCLIEVKGDLLLQTLVRCTASLPTPNSHFPQCSGLKYTIHLKSDTVTDVMVLDRASGEYKPLDLEKNYQVSLPSFYSSIGFYGMMKDCKVIKSDTRTNCDVLTNYLSVTLGGRLGDGYKESQGRITILDD